MKKIIVCLTLLAGFTACSDDSEDIKPRVIKLDVTIATDNEIPPPPIHGN